jgi:hypothetical protein
MKRRRSTHEDDLGLIQLLLDLHDGIGLLWVLVLSDVLCELGVANGFGPLLRSVLVEHFVEDGESDADGVFLVRYQDGCRIRMRGRGRGKGGGGSSEREVWGG